MLKKFNIRPENLSKKHKLYYLVWEVVCGVSLFLWYAYFSFLMINYFVHMHSYSALIYLAYELMIMVFLVIRNLPKNISFSPYDWFVGIAGTIGPTLLRPTEDVLFPSLDFMLVFQIIGLLISFVGLMSLSKSFGIVAADRGIKTNGIFRYIRHPLYSGYFLSLAALLLQNASLYNIIIVAAVFVLKFMRIFAEEKILMENPEYQAYVKKTPWRLIPHVW